MRSGCRADAAELTRCYRSHDAVDGLVERPGLKLDDKPDFRALAYRRAAHDFDLTACTLDHGFAHTQDVKFTHQQRQGKPVLARIRSARRGVRYACTFGQGNWVNHRWSAVCAQSFSTA